jgi:uncharacterized protein (UPF0548 family)
VSVDLTYPEVGATRGDELPDGYRHLRRHERIGVGEDAFRAVVDALRGWDMHRGAGMAVRASGPARVGGRMASGTGPRPLRLWAPVEVVWLLDEPRRFGVGYGTLPGHPVRGEEAFEVHLDQADQVWAEIRAFSRPARWYARLARPLIGVLQDRITERYLRALRRAASGGATPTGSASR